MGRVVGPIGIGIGIPGNGARLPLTPQTILGSALLQWVRADLGITLGGTLRASGTTPPVLTLTGSTSQALGIRVECTTGGARGTWVLRYSLDSGTTWTSDVLSAATVALGTSGITLNIAVGNANVDNVWQGMSSAWADQSGAAKHYSQATAANQPLYFSNGGPNNQAYISIDSAARNMGSALALPAPGTTPSLIWIVMRQPAGYVSGRRFVDGAAGAATHMITQTGVSPACQIFNTSGVNSNTALAIGAWGRAAAYFSNSVNDYLQLIANKVTGANAGNSASTGRSVGAGNGVSSALVDICEVAYINRDLTAIEDTKMNAYCTARYGSGLV